MIRTSPRKTGSSSSWTANPRRTQRTSTTLKKGDLEHAEADCDDAARFAPKSAEARIFRAQVHARRAMKDAAEADLREAGKLAPDPFLDFPRL
jgi:Tfp pilus assembly protein PilF